MDTLATLVFEDLDGEVVVRLSPVPMRVYFDLIKRRAEASTVEDYEALFRAFCDAGLLVSWTFPEPCNFDGLMARDVKFGLAVLRDWVAGVRSVPLPLPRSASGGTESTPEASPPSSR